MEQSSKQAEIDVKKQIVNMKGVKQNTTQSNLGHFDYQDPTFDFTFEFPVPSAPESETMPPPESDFNIK